MAQSEMELKMVHVAPPTFHAGRIPDDIIAKTTFVEVRWTGTTKVCQAMLEPLVLIGVFDEAVEEWKRARVSHLATQRRNGQSPEGVWLEECAFAVVSVARCLDRGGIRCTAGC